MKKILLIVIILSFTTNSYGSTVYDTMVRASKEFAESMGKALEKRGETNSHEIAKATYDCMIAEIGRQLSFIEYVVSKQPSTGVSNLYLTSKIAVLGVECKAEQQ